MANFTTEAAVRLKFQVNDTAWAPSSLVTASIDDAHDAILRGLDPGVDTESPEDGLVLGETLLAGAHLLRSLASKDAVQQKEVTVAGQHIATGKRFASLMALGARVEEEAWRTLEPYLRGRDGITLAVLTDSTPVLGEEGES